jgi:hypothetical protein
LGEKLGIFVFNKKFHFNKIKKLKEKSNTGSNPLKAIRRIFNQQFIYVVKFQNLATFFLLLYEIHIRFSKDFFFSLSFSSSHHASPKLPRNS